MIKFIEFLGRLVVRGYRRAATMERKVAREDC
ncbi:gp3.7 [Escherichia phage EcoDS1]|uniref:Gp3.7 n=1 Tax=Escherichia phage EcoDS1 TaxID=532075 RepID=B3VCU6_9CAUD|nr:gp3.7 [Escherichia phage EcoDS1]ACF15801.1 gp3.7 [Escherichia phage EcoDS1]